MNKILILISFLIVFTQIVYADAYTMYNCKTEFVVHEGKYYKPPSNMQRIEVGISKDMNEATIRTKNQQSFFVYKTFIDDKHVGKGIDYVSDNGRFIDFFKNGYVFLGSVSEGVSLKAYCKDMQLNIYK